MTCVFSWWFLQLYYQQSCQGQAEQTRCFQLAVLLSFKPIPTHCLCFVLGFPPDTLLQWKGDTHLAIAHHTNMKVTRHLAILAVVQEQKILCFSLRGTLKPHINLFAIFFFDSLPCNNTIYWKSIILFTVYFLFSYTCTSQTLFHTVQNCFFFSFLTICFLIRCINFSGSLSKKEQLIAFASENNIFLIIYFWLKDE